MSNKVKLQPAGKPINVVEATYIDGYKLKLTFSDKKVNVIDFENFLNPFLRFSIYIKMARLKRGLTQAQMAKKMKFGLLPYQRLESGTNNPTLKTILKVKEILPEIKMDKVA